MMKKRFLAVVLACFLAVPTTAYANEVNTEQETEACILRSPSERSEGKASKVYASVS